MLFNAVIISLINRQDYIEIKFPRDQIKMKKNRNIKLRFR